MYFTTSAVVMKRTKLSDSDLILTLFTKKAGKMTVVSKGARNAKSKLSASSHPFVFGDFSITTSDSWNHLQSVDISDSFYHLRDDLTKLGYASYLLELTSHVVHEGQINNRLFDLLVEALNLLNKNNENYKLIKLAYEYKLMSILGYRMQMKSCVSCGKSQINKYFISPFEGGVICEDCYEKTRGTIYVGKTLPKLIDYIIEKDIRIVFKTQINDKYLNGLDKIIRPYISHHLEKSNFKTLEFLDVF